MRVIDADGHIIEAEGMFANIDPEFYPRRPIPLFLPSDTVAGALNGIWMIEGKAYPSVGSPGGETLFYTPGSISSQGNSTTLGDQTLEDVEARLAGMDRFQIDQQFLFPTMFLISCVEDVRLEAALFRCYNEYLSKACERANGRLGWTALIPFRDPKEAVKELERASALGASGVFTMGVIFDRQLSDPSFYPIYDAMGELDLPLCVHLGWGSPLATQIFSSNSFFCSASIPVIWGFTFVMTSGLLGRFPKLRVGFIETGSEWVPYTITQVRRHYQLPSLLRDPKRARRRGVDQDYYRDPVDWFREGRAFVTCEIEEDLPYLLKHLGEDGLMLSSDYPHGDPSADESYVAKLEARDDIPEGVKGKLLGDNAARFFRAPRVSAEAGDRVAAATKSC